MRILIATRMQATEEEREAAPACLAWLAGKLAALPGSEAVLDGALDWKAMRRTHGGYFGAYQQVAREFDRVVLVARRDEAGHLMVGRGQYSIADNAFSLGKAVGVWRDGKVERVKFMIVNDRDDWANAYGRVVCEGEEI